MIDISSKIIDYLRDLFGDEFAEKYFEYVKSDFQVYLRLSTFIEDHTLFENRLKEYGIVVEKVKGVPNAYKVLEGQDIIGKTTEHALGHYYIQSLSSMIPPFALLPTSEDKTLDLCAAPGSKTTQLAEMMNNEGTLIANEPSNKRIRSLVHNVDRQNLVNVGVLRFRGETLSKVYHEYFDKVLVDAPCSGLGIVQKKGEINNWWNTDEVARMSDLQFRLLISAIKSAKVGGEILYSTCTMTCEENEFIIDRVLKKYPVELVDVELPVPSHDGLTEYAGFEFSPTLKKARRIVPWDINSEGFFIAKLRKTGPTEKPQNRITSDDPTVRFVSAESKKVKKYVKDLSEYFDIDWAIMNKFKFYHKNRDIYFLNKDWEIDQLGLYERLGLKFGKVDKNDYIILHTHGARVLSDHIRKNIIDLEDEDLSFYMQGGTIKKEYDSTGQKVVRYNGKVMGVAVSTKEGLKSQFPRSLRAQEIIFPK
ncbi:MAG: RsmB/NOP family class I SAM-dependent RNA methyltransferase [Bacteroidetes bacterium]|nr:RsmB/NOP family class I SAM-dependent RNA methyltransferase [Bacteroidota bacterium]